MRRILHICLLSLLLFLSCDYCPTQPRGSIFEWKTSTPNAQDFDTEQLKVQLFAYGIQNRPRL